MKYEVNTEEDGKISLKLGLNHEVTFDKDIDIDGIVQGVEALIHVTTGISAMDLISAVVREQAKPYIQQDNEEMGG